MREPWSGAYRQVRRVFVAVAGGALLLGGVVLLVTPGPGLLLIGAGLALMAAEFAWARSLLRGLREKFDWRRRDPSSQSR